MKLVILMILDIFHKGHVMNFKFNNLCQELEEKAPKSIDCITSGTGLIIDDAHHDFDKWEIQPERLVLQSVLGEGAFGLVRRAWMWDEKGSTSTEVAVKMLKGKPFFQAFFTVMLYTF